MPDVVIDTGWKTKGINIYYHAECMLKGQIGGTMSRDAARYADADPERDARCSFCGKPFEQEAE